MVKRSPRNFFGTEIVTKSLQQLLPEFLQKLRKSSTEDASAVFQAWFQLLGETMGPLTEPVSFVDGILQIKVKSSTLYSLLVQHEKKRLLLELQKKFPIREIFLKVG